VAKVSRINIAITGDSKGLQAATDSARRELNRLNAAAEATSKKLKGFGESAMRVQGVAGQFGVKGTGLGAIGGVGMLASMGGLGLGLGAAGLGIAGISAGVGAVQALPDVRKRAIQALQETQMDQRRRIEEFGFSQQMAQMIAANAPKNVGVATGLSTSEAFAQGMAAQGGGSLAEYIINEFPKVLAAQVGAALAGGGVEGVNKVTAAIATPGTDAQYEQSARLMSPLVGMTLDLYRMMSK
jgi:hypothetical protein